MGGRCVSVWSVLDVGMDVGVGTEWAKVWLERFWCSALVHSYVEQRRVIRAPLRGPLRLRRDDDVRCAGLVHVARDVPHLLQVARTGGEKRRTRSVDHGTSKARSGSEDAA